MHGRIGFYKREWLALGGYDEDLTGCGWDDYNLVLRAMAAGFRLMTWGHLKERFGERMPTPKQDCRRYMECRHMVLTQIVNERATMRKLDRGEFIANQGGNGAKPRRSRTCVR